MNKEYYNPHPMDADSSYHVAGGHIAGFLATVAGTMTVTASMPNAVSNGDSVLLDTYPLVEGFNRIPMLLPSEGGADVQLAGGAAGTLLT